MVAASGIGLLLTSCNAAKAQGPELLSPLSSKEDNLLIGKIESRNPGTLCSLSPSDGQARLMSYGREAVVDVNAVPTLLSYHPDRVGNGAEFTGKGVKISGQLKRENATDLAHTVSRNVTVDVQARGRSEHYPASWTCQATLVTVRLAH